ncbi:MAG: response regulator [Alphaproteobacteria bacterium]|nr:response regulator [Alphaproteobacteria bacterium]
MSEAHFPENQRLDSARTVLVVEDEALIRAVLSDMLHDKGFKVLEAANANEAIEIFKKTTVAIDLVFTDVRMPGSMDGFGLVRWIQSTRPFIPVIVASGDIGKANDSSCMTLGDMFIPKPYDLERTAMKIRKVLESRSR